MRMEVTPPMRMETWRWANRTRVWHPRRVSEPAPISGFPRQLRHVSFRWLTVWPIGLG